MPTIALVVLALSVLMHVTWNLLARDADQESNFLWWGILAHQLIFGWWTIPLLIVQAQWKPVLGLTLAISAAALSLYFVALRRAYHHAPVALVYPLARSSPLLVAIWGAWLFAEELSVGGWLGMLVSTSGLLLLASTADHGRARLALPWALIAALSTSIYSSSDKLAVSYLPTFAAQLGFVSVAYLVALIALSLCNKYERGMLTPASTPAAHRWLIGGLFIGMAYALLIHAMLYLPAAYAVMFSNAGIILAALLSITVFNERRAWRKRLLSVIVVSIGFVMIGLDARQE